MGFHHVFVGLRFSSGPQPWTLGARQSVPRSPKWKTTVDPCNVGKDRTGGIHCSLDTPVDDFCSNGEFS